MNKKLTILTANLAAIAVLAACGGRTPAAGTPTPAASPTTLAAATAVTAECTVVSLVPTAGPTEVSMFPPAADDDWVKGPAGAKVTFIEYSDFQ